MISKDLQDRPGLQFRIDNFVVPDDARAEFEATMHRNLAFIRTLPGFLEHVIFEKSGGPTTFNVATIAVWESAASLEAATSQVRAYYETMGFELPAMTARLGIRAEQGYFRALPAQG